MKPVAAAAAACLLGVCSHGIPGEAPANNKAPADDAAAFGALPFFYSAALSADGKRVVGVGPGTGTNTFAFVLELGREGEHQIKPVAEADGQPMALSHCDWSALDRVVCTTRGVIRLQGWPQPLPLSHTLAMDADGRGKPLALAPRDSGRAVGIRLSDDAVIDWMDGRSGKVLMARNNIPDRSGSRLARDEDGINVVLVDTRSGNATSVERTQDLVTRFASDGHGNIRLKSTTRMGADYQLSSVETHLYRAADSRDWKQLGSSDEEHKGMTPLAVDPLIDAAYVLQPLDGRQALYRIALDGSMKTELVFASPEVDVDDVVRMGRGGRVIGVAWTTDRTQVEYFDPEYRRISATLAKALPRLPLLRFVSASADEKTLLVWAGSDVDPGHLYLYDRERQRLSELFPSRPVLSGKQLSAVHAITYPAADGTKVPAYLTLPPGVTNPHGLPAIVMPHGGPESRDEWGFDWLPQYFAQRGFVVLQPNFRGSSGYGTEWLVNNGFRGWKTAIGDVCDAGRWLVEQGTADPARLAIFGWSYGGYAALQANVLAPDLFKAVVAVAPVTDLELLKDEAQHSSNSRQIEKFIGDASNAIKGSPARNAAAFKAPVLMFHGDMDINVDIMQSRRMNDRLHEAGKASELVVYPKLAHSLVDGGARADMLRRSEGFLRRSLGMGALQDGNSRP